MAEVIMETCNLTKSVQKYLLWTLMLVVSTLTNSMMLHTQGNQNIMEITIVSSINTRYFEISLINWEKLCHEKMIKLNM